MLARGRRDPTFFVGADIANLNHFASIISSDVEVLEELFKHSNDSDGFRLLPVKVDQYAQGSPIIGMESIAHHGNNLVEFLVSLRFNVCVINPILTIIMQKKHPRETKTDCVDTFLFDKHLMAKTLTALR